MANISMQELSELSNDELLDIKSFIEAEMKVRSDLEMNEQVHKLANIIQKMVDSDYTLRVSYPVRADTAANDVHPNYFLEDKAGIQRYRIIPDYPDYDDHDEYDRYGYIINKWNGKKGTWEDITND